MSWSDFEKKTGRSFWVLTWSRFAKFQWVRRVIKTHTFTFTYGPETLPHISAKINETSTRKSCYKGTDGGMNGRTDGPRNWLSYEGPFNITSTQNSGIVNSSPLNLISHFNSYLNIPLKQESCEAVE